MERSRGKPCPTWNDIRLTYAHLHRSMVRGSVGFRKGHHTAVTVVGGSIGRSRLLRWNQHWNIVLVRNTRNLQNERKKLTRIGVLISSLTLALVPGSCLAFHTLMADKRVWGRLSLSSSVSGRRQSTPSVSRVSPGGRGMATPA